VIHCQRADDLRQPGFSRARSVGGFEVSAGPGAFIRRVDHVKIDSFPVSIPHAGLIGDPL
jgi:hypothetical protein